MVVRELIAKFGYKTDLASFKKAGGGIEKLKVAALGMTAATAGAFIGMQAFVSRMANFGDGLAKTSQQLGISATNLRAWQHAAELSGVNGAQLSAGFTALGNTLRGVRDGTKEQVEAFDRLGVEVRDRNGEFKSMDQLLLETGSAIGGLKNPTDKVIAAQQIFGRSGKALIPLFNQGADGMKKMREEIFALYGKDGLNKFSADSANYNDAMLRFAIVKQAVAVTIARDLIPAFIKFARWLGKTTRVFLAFAKKIHLGKVMLASLGTAAIAAAGLMITAFGGTFVAALPLIGTLLAAAAAVAVVVLVVDELYNLFTGGETVIAEFIDALFGVGATQVAVDGIRDTFSAIVHYAKEALKFIQPVVDSWLKITGVGKLLDGGKMPFETTNVQGITRAMAASANNQSNSTNVGTINISSPDPKLAGEAVRRELEAREGQTLRRAQQAFAQPAPG